MNKKLWSLLVLVVIAFVSCVSFPGTVKVDVDKLTFFNTIDENEDFSDQDVSIIGLDNDIWLYLVELDTEVVPGEVSIHMTKEEFQLFLSLYNGTGYEFEFEENHAVGQINYFIVKTGIYAVTGFNVDNYNDIYGFLFLEAGKTYEINEDLQYSEVSDVGYFSAF